MLSLTKSETELITALLYCFNMKMIDLKEINKTYFNGDSFINELDLSIAEKLEEKLDHHLPIAAP